MNAPIWLHEVHSDYHCDRCDAAVPDGDPAAWQADEQDGSLLCLDCGCDAEDEAAAS